VVAARGNRRTNHRLAKEGERPRAIDDGVTVAKGVDEGGRILYAGRSQLGLRDSSLACCPTKSTAVAATQDDLDVPAVQLRRYEPPRIAACPINSDLHIRLLSSEAATIHDVVCSAEISAA